MSRNVARSTKWPCAQAQCHTPVTQHGIRRWYSETEQAEETQENVPEVALVQDREQTLAFLRNLDQKHLAACRRGTDKILCVVPKAKDEIAALPVTVQSIQSIPPYTIGSLKRLTRIRFPETAKWTMGSARHVREHLIDLQYQPYDRADKNGSTAFEREVAEMTEEQKWEKYNEVKLRAEAQARRLVWKFEDVGKKTKETIARQTKKSKAAPRQPMPSFGDGISELTEMEAQAFKDVEDVEIVTEGKGEEGWDAVKREARGEAVSSFGWNDEEEAWVSPIRAMKTDKTDFDEAADDRSEATEVSELKIRKSVSGLTSVRKTGAQLEVEEERSAKKEQKRSSLDELKDSLGATVFKDRKK